MPVVKNEGSAARDFCMLERNILSHFKLALLLLLLSASILLHARLPAPKGEQSAPPARSKAGLPIATLQMLAALAAILAGTWEYLIGNRDLRQMKAFLAYTKPHTAVLTVVAGVVFTTCVVLLADDNGL